MAKGKRVKVENKTGKLTMWQHIGMFFYKRRAFTLLLLLAVVLYGGLSYTTFMRREGFPAVNVPLGIVRVIAFKDSASEVDQNYTSKIIEQSKNLSGVKSVNGTSTNQGGSITISFKDGTNVDQQLSVLKSKVSLPADAQAIFVTYEGGKQTSEGDDLLVSVHSSGLTPAQLDEKANEVAAYLSKKVPLAERVKPISLIEKTVDPATGAEQAQQVRFDRYYGNGTSTVEPSAVVAIKGVSGVDQLKLYDEVESAISEGSEISSLGVQVSIAANFAESIREQVSGLQTNLLEGLIVVLIVSFILIGWRASLITAAAMTTTVIATVGVLHLIGYTLNTITLFSLVLCLALIVDDTTIVIEAIDAGLKRGESIKESVLTSLKKVALASSTGTLTTILAFAPMLFIGGILGKFIRAIPVTIIISLAASLVVSVIFIPVMMRILVGSKKSFGSRKIDLAEKLEKSLGRAISGTIIWSGKSFKRAVSVRTGAVLVSLLFIVGGVMTFAKVKFDIFPAPKDGTELVLSANVIDREGASIENTQILSDRVLSIVQSELGDDLKGITLTGQQGSADRDGFYAVITLSDLKKRKITSVELSNRLRSTLVTQVPQMRIVVEASGVGPPAGAFVAQIVEKDGGDTVRLTADLKTFLEQASLTRVDGTTARFKDVSITPSTLVVRSGSDKIVSVSAAFDAKDTSALVTLGQKAVEKEFTAEKLSQYGFSESSLKFDFGQEQENQDSFASMGEAAIPLFIAMFVLMAVLFRSLLQPLLIFTALPFALFGVANGLYGTKNPISFFSMLGVFALIGISVNNTILLTDYANQSKKTGKNPVEAIAEAMRERLRPLLTTSVTSILALLPLALNDPFWEGLAYTLIFGLISSTILVLVVFPYFYLINDSISRLIRKALGKVIPGLA